MSLISPTLNIYIYIVLGHRLSCLRFLAVSQPDANSQRRIEESDEKETRRDSVPADIYFLP